MENIEKKILDHYENLVTEMDEVRQVLGIIWHWLNKTIDIDDRIGVYSFFAQHDQQHAVLNLVIDKLTRLNEQHSENIRAIYQEEANHDRA